MKATLQISVSYNVFARLIHSYISCITEERVGVEYYKSNDGSRATVKGGVVAGAHGGVVGGGR